MPAIYWFHSIDIGDHVTPGQKPADLLASEWDKMHLPALAGKSVLDIGCWDGYFSFRAEEAGASRVVALDHYVWSMRLEQQQAYYRECKAAGTAPDLYHERPELWDPVGLPGKAGFDLAHRARASRVEPVVGDFMTTDLATLGVFDIVFFLGVLYHLEEPLTGLRRLRQVTRELALIETVATFIEGQEQRPIAEFFPGAELDGDVSNWWSTNETALHGLCHAAGFSSVETVATTPTSALDLVDGAAHYRITVHARP